MVSWILPKNERKIPFYYNANCFHSFFGRNWKKLKASKRHFETFRNYLTFRRFFQNSSFNDSKCTKVTQYNFACWILNVKKPANLGEIWIVNLADSFSGYSFGDLTNLKTASEIFLPVQYMSITTHIPYTMQNRPLFSGRLSPYCILGM